MLFNIPFIADWKKLETTGSTRLIATHPMRTQNELIGIMQLVTKYKYRKIVSSEKVKVSQRSLDYYSTTYEWNDQDLMQSYFRETQH
jgi:hypothetical protein